MAPPGLPAIFEARRSPRRSTINIHSRAVRNWSIIRQFLRFFSSARSAAEHVERCLCLLTHRNGTNHTALDPLILYHSLFLRSPHYPSVFPFLETILHHG